jgi:hypothetical protein
VADLQYRYELWGGLEMVATGRFASDGRLEAGEQVTIGAFAGVVREITPTVTGGELRLVVDV